MSGQTHFEFFFDISSPWTYLAFARVEDLAARCGVEIDWKPVLVGGVFNAVNETVYEARANPHPVKGRYYVKDLKDWAAYCGVEIGNPPVFPLRAVGVMRAACYKGKKIARRNFRNWLFTPIGVNWCDISQPEELAALPQPPVWMPPPWPKQWAVMK